MQANFTMQAQANRTNLENKSEWMESTQYTTLSIYWGMVSIRLALCPFLGDGQTQYSTVLVYD